MNPFLSAKNLAEIENDARIVKIEQPDGSVEIDFLNDEEAETNDGPLTLDGYENLVIYLDEDELSDLAELVINGYEDDESSRYGHMQALADGISQLGLSDSDVETPFEGACTVFHPLIMENAVKLQAKAEGELLPAKGPVKTEILGRSTEELELKAYRVQRHMNWQLTSQMPEYYTNTQKALLQTPLFGDSFKKNYWDPIKGRACDYLIPIDRFVVNNSCDNIEGSERITEVQYISEAEMLRRQFSGLYSDEVILPQPYTIEKTELGRKIDSLLGITGDQEGYEVLEQHVFMDYPQFDGEETGVPLPYIVVVEKSSRQVLALYKNGQDTNAFVKKEWFTQLPFVPGFGFYNLGYIHLLGNFQSTLTAILRSLVDSGSFANMQGGFKLKSMRVLDDGASISPGEFRDVEFYGNDISKGIYPLQFKEPSQTLFAVLQFIEGRGQKFADSAEQVVADAANYGPVGTTMALLDASTKFFSTIFKRLHTAQKKQLDIIARLNYENMPEDDSSVSFNVPGEELRISKLDYGPQISIIPVSDPNIPSAAHRVTMASQKLQAAMQSPHLFDMREIYKQYFTAMGDENYRDYMPEPEEPQPQEPMGDIMLASQGKPIKAFPEQDHKAHISIKTAFINDPSVGQNPNFAQALPAIQANIREHVIMAFGQQLEGAQALGLGAQEAAQQISEFNTWKAQNPLGVLDPKQLLAQAEIMRQENEALKLKFKEKELKADIAVDIMENETEVRKQDLDMVQFGIKLKQEEDLLRFKEALDFVRSSLDTKKDSI